MKSIAALFPGQGSQVPGMSKTLTENFPWTKAIFEEASETIKEDLLKLCAEGPAETLQLTMNAQPCILTTSFAWYQVLEKNLDFLPQAGAGHSLGEYSALLASKALGLEEAVTLVRKRGEFMQQAVPKGRGKMAAILGLSDENIMALCQAASEGETSLVVPANFNAPNQVVVAGHAEAVDRVSILATDGKKPDWQARKVIPLNVSAPFHCPLMKPVAQSFVPYLEKVAWKTPKFPVASNLDGKLRFAEDPIPLLRDQIDHSVQWVKCVQALEQKGCEVFVEVGPSKILTGLVKRIVDKKKVFSLDSLDDLKAFETAFRGGFA